MKAGQRLRALRELMGISRRQFSEVINIDFEHLTSVELGRTRMVDDDFEKVLKQFPYFAHWITYAGDIDMEGLKKQRDELMCIVYMKLQVGLVPPGYGFERFKKSDGEK